MEIQEYKDKLKDLYTEFDAKKKELAEECALSNNPYKVGDIVSDHIGTIKILEIIGTHTSYGWDSIPCCTYLGLELLKKDKTPKKGDLKRTVFQSNIIK